MVAIGGTDNEQLGAAGTIEEFNYDVNGNPLSLLRVSGNPMIPSEDWTYGQAIGSQVPSRNLTEDFNYEPVTGRLLRSQITGGGLPLVPAVDTTQIFAYDGLGRLVRTRKSHNLMANAPIADHLIAYDGDNNAVYEEHQDITGLTTSAVHRFGGERYDSVSGQTVYAILPMLDLVDEGGQRQFQWNFVDQDGHALGVYDDQGSELQYEVTGVYGERLENYLFDLSPSAWGGKSWDLAGLHGQEVNHQLGMAHRGVRHSMLTDGRWLQPEPLLGLGLTGKNTEMPSSYTSVYAAGNPLRFFDASGFAPMEFIPGQPVVLPDNVITGIYEMLEAPLPDDIRKNFSGNDVDLIERGVGVYRHQETGEYITGNIAWGTDVRRDAAGRSTSAISLDAYYTIVDYDLVLVVHTHPGGPAILSQGDVKTLANMYHPELRSVMAVEVEGGGSTDVESAATLPFTAAHTAKKKRRNTGMTSERVTSLRGIRRTLKTLFPKDTYTEVYSGDLKEGSTMTPYDPKEPKASRGYP